jgi:hypothetical protein
MKTAQKAKFEPPKRSMIFSCLVTCGEGKALSFLIANTHIYYVTVMLVLVLVLVLVFTLDFPQTFHRTVIRNVPWTVRRISCGFLVDFLRTRFKDKEYKCFCLYQKILSVIRIFKRVIGKVPIFACKLERVSG